MRSARSVGRARAMNTVAPNSPSDTANAKPAATISARRTDRQVDLAPDRARRGTEHGGRLAQPVVDRPQHGQHRPHHERHRRPAPARGAPAPRTRAGPAGLVERDEEAEADRDRRGAERQHQQRGRTSGRRCDRGDRRATIAARPPTTIAMTVAATVETSRSWRACAPVARRGRSAGRGAPARGGSRGPSARRDATTVSPRPRAAFRGGRPSTATFAQTSALSRALAGRLRAAADGSNRCWTATPLLVARVEHEHRAEAEELEDGEAAGHGQVEELPWSAGRSPPPPSRSRPAEEQHDTERREREQEHDGRRGRQRRSHQREGHLRNVRHRLAPSVRAASSRRGSRCAPARPPCGRSRHS